MRTILSISIFFVISYLITTVYYVLYDGGSMYVYFKKSNPRSEALRKEFIQNMTFFDRLFVIGYSNGYINSLENIKKAESGLPGFSLEQTRREIERDGICELNGEQVSMYAYFKTKTIFGVPYTEYVITCNRVERRSYLDLLRNTKTIRAIQR